MNTAEKAAVIGVTAAAGIGLAYVATRPSSASTPAPTGTPANITLAASVSGYIVTFSVLITDMNGNLVVNAGSGVVGNGWEFGIPPTNAQGMSSTEVSFASGTYSATALTTNGIQSTPVTFTVTGS